MKSSLPRTSRQPLAFRRASRARAARLCASRQPAALRRASGPPAGLLRSGRPPAAPLRTPRLPVTHPRRLRPAAALRGAPRLLAALLLAALGACGDQGPVSGAGAFTVTLVSPNGPEGAAVVELLGDGLGEITAYGDTEVYSYASEGRTRVVLIDPSGGTLAFRVAVADTTQRPTSVVREVAGLDDELRPTTAGYVLELSR